MVVSPGGVIGQPLAIPPQMMDSLLLPTPSLNLVLEYFFTVVASGQDPLPRFRGLNETENGEFTSPVAGATCPSKGPWSGSSSKGFSYASKGFKSNYGCPPEHHHHNHHGDTTE